MSSKRRRRNAEAEFFVYTPGVAVPRDVTRVIIPASVEVLPDRTFSKCRRLREVVLPAGLRKVGLLAFSGCCSLRRVCFHSTLVIIPDACGDPIFFVYTQDAVGVPVPQDITHLLIPPSVEVLRDDQFFPRLTCLKEVVFLEGLQQIEKETFWDCTALECANFPLTLIKIDDGAFKGCTSLRALNFQSRDVEIGHFAFFGCSSLVHLRLRAATIGKCAFAKCSSLEAVTLLDGIQIIGWSAFQGCKLLRRVKLCGGIHLIKRDAFSGCNLLEHIGIPPKGLVARKFPGGYHNINFVTDGIIPTEHEQVVITSDCFYSMQATGISALETPIVEILNTSLLRRLDWDDAHERLRNVLAPHERRRKKEVTSLLELGLWKAEMRRTGGTGPGARRECRVTCKAGDVLRNVVPFL